MVISWGKGRHMPVLVIIALLHATTLCCSAEEALLSSQADDSAQKNSKSTDVTQIKAADEGKSSVPKDDDARKPKDEKVPADNALKKDDVKATDDKGGDAKKAEAADGVNTDIDGIPPPPEPTPEEVAKRKEKAAEYQSLGEKFFDFPVTGSLLNRYRLRHGVGETDQDFTEFITVDLGEKTREMATAHIDARISEDPDRKHNLNRSDVFTDLLDTYNRPVDARVYSAYVDFNRLCGVDFLRVGRQFDYETPEILNFDGARLDTKPLCGLDDMTLSFYAGIPVHQFEKSDTGDWLAGLAAEFKPWDSGKLRLDYIHINDNFSDEVIPSQDPLLKSLSPNGGTRKNDLESVSFWQSFKDPDVRLNGHFSLIDGEARDLQVRSTYNNACNQLQICAIYSLWFKPQTELVTEFDPYNETLQGQEPYQNGSLTVSKGLLKWLWLDVGAASRRLVGDAKSELFNREFDRFYTTLQTRDWLKRGLKMSVTATRWDGKDGAASTTQYGGEVCYEWRKHLETNVGTDYEMYKYDFFQNTEHDQDRTYYIRQRWKPTRWATLDARYEYEQSRSQHFNSFTMNFRFDF